jgi:hypothetical protein
MWNRVGCETRIRLLTRDFGGASFSLRPGQVTCFVNILRRHRSPRPISGWVGCIAASWGDRWAIRMGHSRLGVQYPETPGGREVFRARPRVPGRAAAPPRPPWGSGLFIGRDTCFVNIVWRHRPPCLTSGSQQGSIGHHGNSLRVQDQPNGARRKSLVRATIGISAPFRPVRSTSIVMEPVPAGRRFCVGFTVLSDEGAVGVVSFEDGRFDAPPQQGARRGDRRALRRAAGARRLDDLERLIRATLERVSADTGVWFVREPGN